MNATSMWTDPVRALDGEGTPGSDGGERITRLFPKCRPKTLARNHDRMESHTEINNVHNASSDDEHPDANQVIVNPKNATYRLRDSRIIEIAGGRELYSVSRTKPARKLRHSATHKHSTRTKNRSINKDKSDFTAENFSELYRNSSETKKMISRHTSPTYTNGERDPEQSLSIPRNSSPVLDPHKTNDSSKSSPIAVVADGKVVVFDDNDDWNVILNSVSVGLTGLTRDLSSELENRTKLSEVLNSKSDSDSLEDGVWSGDEERGKLRVIGELPIAQYEGSPRRYGLGVQVANNLNSNKSPRPGFPQRVVTESRDVTPPSSSAAFDYLYEFSETRKVLEEFFRCPPITGQGLNNIDVDGLVNFHDIEYDIHRDVEDCMSENGIEGGSESEWPHVSDTMDSPHAINNHTDFLGLQHNACVSPSPLPSLLLRDSSSSPPPPPSPPSPSPSPSPLSPPLRLISIRHYEHMQGLADLSRTVSVQLPIVEDGLSSGHASDTDNNNQMPIVQNHTSSVIEEIVENGTSNEPHVVLSHADLNSLDPLACSEMSPPPPAPAPHRPTDIQLNNRKRPSSAQSTVSLEIKPGSNDEEEADTDLETDRLLGQQRTDDQGFFDDKGWRKPKSRTVMPPGTVTTNNRSPPHIQNENNDPRDDENRLNKDKDAKKKSKSKEDVNPSVLIEGVLFRARYLGSTQLACEGQPTKATRMLQAEEAVSRIKWGCEGPYSGVYAAPAAVFRLSFLGSIEVDEDSRRRKKRPKKIMVEEAVTKIKAPEGENQPSTEVDLFISTEKIMVLNTELKEIMMDHALRTISYIADIGDLVVLMARRRFVPHDNDDQTKLNRTPKMICHVFESEEAQFIAQSIGQAFQVAYMEFLKANGIEDHSFVKEMDYQEVLNSQEIFGDELQMFAKKELQKEVVVPKSKGEILGVVVVESGWGSMLPTVVIANLAPAGAAARCGQLNIGDQIIAINGVSLVGLPLSTCQNYIKNSKNQTVVKLTVVPCAPVVEVKIKRPDTKYQLGFSVQNGVICSLLRGGIAERGGVRVGHRIIEINSQSVVAVPHERIVNLLATSVGEILMKTMPTSMFRLLTGQENPVFI